MQTTSRTGLFAGDERRCAFAEAFDGALILIAAAIGAARTTPVAATIVTGTIAAAIAAPAIVAEAVLIAALHLRVVAAEFAAFLRRAILLGPILALLARLLIGTRAAFAALLVVPVLIAIAILLGVILARTLAHIGLLAAGFGFDTFGLFAALGLFALAAFIFVVEVLAEALLELGNLMRLHGPKHAVIMLRVLLIAFSADPIAGRHRVPRILHVFLVDRGGGAADLRVFWAVAFERAVRLVSTTTAAARFAATAALTLHVGSVSSGYCLA